MKRVINCLAISMFFLLALASCNKSEDTAAAAKVFAPNNVLVSESMEDFTATIAYGLDAEVKDITIESISYLDVEEGFVAEVEVYNSATDVHSVIYGFSPQLKDKIRYDSSVEVAEVATDRTVPVIVGFPTARCECQNALNNDGCRINGKLRQEPEPDFTIVLNCYNTTCYSGCTLIPG
ncbi:MAG: hypothetical protein AAGG75_05120 [Bacteroidota bacterium]